jgi:hypothetical protein
MTVWKTPDMTIIYVAFPIARSDGGQALPDEDAAIQCVSAAAACLVAEQMARTPPFAASLAFSREGNAATGEFGPAQVLMRYGEIAW